MRRVILFASSVVAVLLLAGESMGGPIREWVREHRPGVLIPKRDPGITPYPAQWYHPQIQPVFTIHPDATGAVIPHHYYPAVQPGVIVSNRITAASSCQCGVGCPCVVNPTTFRAWPQVIQAWPTVGGCPGGACPVRR